MNSDDSPIVLKPDHSADSEPVIVLQPTTPPAQTPPSEVVQLPHADTPRLQTPSPDQAFSSPRTSSSSKKSKSSKSSHKSSRSQSSINWEQADPQPKSFSAWGWFVLLFLILISGISWSLYQVFNHSTAEHQKITNDQIQQSLTTEQELEASITNSENTIRAYFLAPTPQERLKFCRHPDAIASRMAKYYQTYPYSPATSVTVHGMTPVIIDSNNFFLSSVTINKSTKCQVIAEQMPNHEFKIDWEHQVGYQPIPWPEFAANGKPGESLDFRVVASPDNYYNYEFSNTNDWTSFNLSHPSSPIVVYGYAKKNSPEEQKLIAAIKANRLRPTSVILKLTSPSGIKARHTVVIESVVSTTWLHTTPPES